MCGSVNGSWIRRYELWCLKLFKEIFAQLQQNFINLRKKYVTGNHTTEQADNLPLRYVTVMLHTCIVFVSLVS